jgi:galactonate dehydratase
VPTIVDIAAFSARISGKTIWTFVRARSADGLCGWGEATLQGEAAAVRSHVEQLAPATIGQLARPPNRASAAQSTAEAAALCAIDQALWDVLAQQQGRSLADMLGEKRHTRIGLYANINRGTVDRSPSGFAARALEAASSGFDSIKIAPFDDVTPDSAETPAGRRLQAVAVERIAAVRAAIGPNRRLLVDCHWRLTEATACEVLRELEPLHLYWFECPLVEVPAAFSALRRIRAQANAMGVRLAGCESMTGLDVFRSFLNAGVYDVIMPDVKYAGGLEEILRIGEAAAAHDVLCSPHNPTGPIAHLHSVHVCSLLAASPFLEFQYGESPLFFDIVDGALPDPNTGVSAVPDGKGLGAGIDMTKLTPLLA